MDLNLTNKVAIVTGASQGIGKAITETLSSEGVKIAIISRNIDALDKVKNKLDKDDILTFGCDIRNSEKLKEIVKEIYNLWGRIDILVNNAGITRDNILLRLSEQDWDDVINTNLKGYFNMMKSVIRYMIKNKYGKIINITSIIGQIGNIGQSNYAASKSGVEGMTRSLALELSLRNINVNNVAPGYISTALTSKLDEKSKKGIEDNIPLSRIGTPEEVANLVCFLSSDLSSYITGQTINIDGGMTIK